MRKFLGCVALLAALVGAAWAATDGWKPRPQARVEADPAAWYSPALFKVKGKPQAGEWIAAHPETIQTFDDLRGSNPVRPTAARHTVYLSVVGPMKPSDAARLEVLREFMEVYFTLPVRMGPPATLDGVSSRPGRGADPAVRQYLTRDILSKTLPPLVPGNGLCLLGVTMQDLFPDPSWNFVFGEAMLDQRVGVYSLVRFYPAFMGGQDTPESDKLVLRRSLQVLVHETGHMFGVHHCQRYECMMNGSNSMDESDRAPMHLCPDCLKKFRWNIGFDVVDRYAALAKFYRAHDMAAEADWVDKRLKECGGPRTAEAAKPAPAKAP
jgi:archaemetzincin